MYHGRSRRRRCWWNALILVVVAMVALTGVNALAEALTVKVGKPRVIMRESHYPVLLRLADGTIIADAAAQNGTKGDDGRTRKAVISSDGGKKWRESASTVIVSHDGCLCVLLNGTAVAIGYHTRPTDGSSDRFMTSRWVSCDHWKTIKGPTSSVVEMPDVVKSEDDGGKGYFGPLFHGRGTALADGAIITTMYGKFGADRQFGDKSRSVLVKSMDQGVTWRYVSTIASLHGVRDQQLLKTWQDGFGEPTLVVLPTGRMVCAMRTGTYAGDESSSTYGDLAQTTVRKGKYVTAGTQPTRPIYLAISEDDGRTWSDPRPVPGAVGACPRLLVLDNGVLVLSFGRLRRPSQGVAMVFSRDGGETWTNRTDLSDSLSSGYSDMVTLGPDKFLCVYDSVTAWPPKIVQDWVEAVDVEVTMR